MLGMGGGVACDGGGDGVDVCDACDMMCMGMSSDDDADWNERAPCACDECGEMDDISDASCEACERGDDNAAATSCSVTSRSSDASVQCMV